MATTRDISVIEYFSFMGDLMILTKDKINPDIINLKLNNEYMDDSALICKESLLVNTDGNLSLAEPMAIVHQSTSTQDIQKAISKIVPILSNILGMYTNALTALYVKQTEINGKLFYVLYNDVIIPNSSYEDMLLFFNTFKEIQNIAERTLIQSLYEDYISTGKIIVNMVNPENAINYVREVMSSRV